MSVLIKGFEKPDHCLRCPMKGIDDECVLQGVEVCDEYEEWEQQMANCPLVPAADVVERPRWIPVTEALPVSVDDDVLVTDGEGYAVGYWRPDAQAWDSTDFGWLENRSEPPCGIHTVTHWMPLPPLPEPPKEEAK